jgi:hypothetical protein
MYGKGPRIEPEESKGDTNKSTNEQGAKKEAEKTAGKPETKGDETHANTPRGSLMSGTEGIPSHEGPTMERNDMFHGRMRDHQDMHRRHEVEHTKREHGGIKESHAEMNERHRKELQSLHTSHERELKIMNDRHAGTDLAEQGEKPAKSVGEEGTEP